MLYVNEHSLTDNCAVERTADVIFDPFKVSQIME